MPGVSLSPNTTGRGGPQLAGRATVSTNQVAERAKMPRSQKILNVLMTFGFLTLVVLSIMVFLQNIKLKRVLGEVMQARTIPYLINGLNVDVMEHVSIRSSFGSADDGGRKLILASSDDCGYCAKNLPNWRTLIESLDSSLGVEIWLIKF
jgi:hypothetical protein